MKTPQNTQDRTFAAKLRSYDVVSAAIQTHGGGAADVLNGRRSGAVAGREAFDYRLVFGDLGAKLASAKQEMLSANAIHLGQLAKVSDLQQRRDELKDELLAKFTPTRHTLENLFGSVRGFTVVGVAGDTLRDPQGLVKQVRDTVGFLEEPKVELSTAVVGVQADFPTVAENLAQGADRLEEALTEHAEADKDAETTRQTKNEAIESYDRTFLHVAQTTEGLFNLAGLHDLAKRVRPSRRRPGRRAAEAGGDASADEAPSSEPTSSQESTPDSTEA